MPVSVMLRETSRACPNYEPIAGSASLTISLNIKGGDPDSPF
jgi:hypothetical protein